MKGSMTLNQALVAGGGTAYKWFCGGGTRAVKKDGEVRFSNYKVGPKDDESSWGASYTFITFPSKDWKYKGWTPQ